MEAAAPSDGNLVSYESYAHAKDLVEVEELNSVTMKGIDREIEAFSVIRDFKLKKLALEEVEQPSVNNKKNLIELRIDKLEKLVAELHSRNS